MSLNIDIERYDEIYDYAKSKILPPLSNGGKYNFLKHYKTVAMNENGELVNEEGKIIIRRDKINQTLTKLYKNPITSRNGIYSFFNIASSKYIGISRLDVKKFLQNQENYQIHKTYNKKHIVNKPIITHRCGERLAIDLIILDKLGNVNSGYKYALTCIDAFTKYAWVFPLKTRELPTIIKHVSEVLEDLKPVEVSVIQADNEMNKNVFKEAFEPLAITLLFSKPYTPQTNGCIERFNGTLKRMMYAYFTQYNTKNWVSVLSEIVQCYNNTKHSTTQRIPRVLLEEAKSSSMDLRKLHKDVHANIVRKAEAMTKRWGLTPEMIKARDKLKKGDHVRIVRKKQIFDKSYINQNSKQIYEVRRKFKDGRFEVSDGKRIVGLFYINEVLRVNINKLQEVDSLTNAINPQQNQQARMALISKRPIRKEDAPAREYNIRTRAQSKKIVH